MSHALYLSKTMRESKSAQARGEWWIERSDGSKVAGPFTTEWDASLARGWVEKVMKPETFWLREGGTDE